MLEAKQDQIDSLEEALTDVTRLKDLGETFTIAEVLYLFNYLSSNLMF